MTVGPGPGAVSPDRTEFGLLGPLSVTVAGAPVVIRAAKVRIVLAALLLSPRRSTSVDELADRLWGDAAPNGARNAVQTYVMRLRKQLGPAGDLVRTEPAGYRIDVSRCTVDVRVFGGCLERARTAGDPVAEAAALREGLALWRGQPLMDVPSPALHVYEVPRLMEARLQATERRIDIDIELGTSADLVGELRQLTAEHRLQERFWGQLMLVLYRQGRQAEALRMYDRVRTLQRDELGLDPGHRLQAVYQQILVADPALAVPPATVVRHPSATPFQVPPDITGFTGRAELVAEIRALVEQDAQRASAAPVITLSGPPGVGKSALAIHNAHRLRPDFPDGSLYVNLRGHARSPPMTANEALERFLRALGVPSETIPGEVDEQSALFRSILIDRRMLVILDDAASADQVRPLLPGGAHCVALVTSRNNLSGLSALNGARRLPVPTVSAQESRDLLAAIVGPDRVAADPAATTALVDACGRLPLALRIVAANLAAEPGAAIGSAMARLESDRLGSMVIDGDDDTAVRRAFDLSYRTLDPDTARMFRLLSLIKGAGFDEWTAAALAAVEPGAAARMLLRLTATNLVQGDQRSGLRFHDLIRDYARDRAHRDDAAEVADALGRLVDFYLRTADAAGRTLYPDLYPGPAPAPAPGITLPPWDGPEDALRWLDEHADDVVAMIDGGPVPAGDRPVWSLATTLLGYFLRRRRDAAWHTAYTRGLALAEAAADPASLAALHQGLGLLHFLHAEYEPARSHYEAAIDGFRALGDPVGQAGILHDLGAVRMVTGGYGDAVGSYRTALGLLTGPDHPVLRVGLLIDLGIVLDELGDTGRGRRHLREACALAERAGLRSLAARATAALGWADLAAGDLRPAAERFTRALAVWTDLGYRSQVAQALRHLAETHFEAGRYAESRDFAERGLALAQEAGDTWAIAGSSTALGVLCEQEGRVREAIAHLERAVGGPRASLHYWRSPVAVALAACHRRLGATDRAVLVLGEAMRDQRPRVRARAHAERARVALAAGDLDAAEKHAAEARRISTERGLRLDASRASAILGETSRRLADDAAARGHFRRAQLGFGEDDAVAAERMGVLIDRLGGTP